MLVGRLGQHPFFIQRSLHKDQDALPSVLGDVVPLNAPVCVSTGRCAFTERFGRSHPIGRLY